MYWYENLLDLCKVKNRSVEKCKYSCKGRNRIPFICLNMHRALWSDNNLRTVVTYCGGGSYWEMVNKKKT